jgi:hypothetical protein
MFHPLKKYLLLALALSSLETSADTISHRRLYLDSMARAMKQKRERLDSTISTLDRMMDSITRKPAQKLDTMAIYRYLQMRNKREQRQKEMLYLKVGLLCLAAVLVLAGWGRWKKRKTRLGAKKQIIK